MQGNTTDLRGQKIDIDFYDFFGEDQQEDKLNKYFDFVKRRVEVAPNVFLIIPYIKASVIAKIVNKTQTNKNNISTEDYSDDAFVILRQCQLQLKDGEIISLAKVDTEESNFVILDEIFMSHTLLYYILTLVQPKKKASSLKQKEPHQNQQQSPSTPS